MGSSQSQQSKTNIEVLKQQMQTVQNNVRKVKNSTSPSQNSIQNIKLQISELKNFVASGNSFKAKPGEHDDLVMSTLLAVRMASTISAWDQKLFERLRDSEEELIMPMPIVIT